MEGDRCAEFLSLISWTDQSVRNVKESTARLDAAKQVFEAGGGRLIFSTC